MLTPAEESGLAGMRIAGRVQRALEHIAPGRLRELMEELQREAAARHLIYQHEGVTETIRIMPCPVTVRPDQLAYIHSVSVTIQNALKRLPDLYFSSGAVRDVLRLTEVEDRWLQECWSPNHRENNPVFGRLDAMVDVTSAMWKDSIKFVEPNLTGIGGPHISPMCDEIVATVVVPELIGIDPRIRLTPQPDMRELMAQELIDHLEAIGRPMGAIALIDPKFEQDGPDEQDKLATQFHNRHGLTVVHVDPSELRLRNGEVYCGDTRIDVGYRDYSVLDLEEAAGKGVDIEPMRVLFRENRMVSSIAAELDQKSCWEILTDSKLVQPHFSPEERQVFRRHILWTRILSDRRTTNTRGEAVDLLVFTRRERETLVIKPNRSFGGKGVFVGPAVTQTEWEHAVDAALRDTERWVVQEVAPIPVREFPVVAPDGSILEEPFYLVMGFAANRYGVSIMTRASQKQVVNVAQRGGVCAVMVSN